MTNPAQTAGKPLQPPRWPEAVTGLVSFDGGVRATSPLQRPDRYRFFGPSQRADGLRIPRGAGLSYAAASFGDGATSIEHGSFDRILGFDSATKIVKVEAGITLGALYDFLIARGLYLPVQPGHGAITVGGCIAADVHGKNHARDGSFSAQVVSLSLFHPDHGLLELSRDRYAALFELTCGGYGLTGHILSADIKTTPLPGGSVHLQSMEAPDVSSGLESLRRTAQHSDFAYSWHDFMRKGPQFGKGFVVAASFMPEQHEPERSPLEVPTLSAGTRGRLPLALLNRWTVAPFNRTYSLRATRAHKDRRVSLASALFPAHQAQAYFALFGKNGFHEYQVVVPWERAQEYLEAVSAYLRAKPTAVTLASAKCFGGSTKLLRFGGQGMCLALNVPRCDTSNAFLQFLDDLLPQVGAIPNLIKDSRVPRLLMERCYREADEFRSQLASFDPKRRFQSELSQRLGL